MNIQAETAQKEISELGFTIIRNFFSDEEQRSLLEVKTRAFKQYRTDCQHAQWATF